MPDSSSESANAEPLLVVTPQSWRETCFSLPAVRALSLAGNPVGILCPEHQRQFWAAAGFDALTAYPANASPRAIASLINQTPRALLWEAGPAADACAKAGVKERVGLPAPKLAKRLTRVLERIVKPGPPEHDVTRFLDVARLLGADPMKPQHFVPIECPKEKSSLLVIPESDYASIYEWPVDRWVELVTRLKDTNRSLCIGLVRTSSLAQELADRTECEAITVDPSNPAGFNSHADLLAADGSLPHVAAAFGTRCAVLFGPADPDLTRPLGRQHLIIRRKVECSPCFLEKCPIDLRCQNDLGVERAFELLNSLSPA